MTTVVGLGNCGCRLAKNFEIYPQYNIYYINTSVPDTQIKNYYKFPEFDHPELYENNCPDFTDFFKDIDDEILFILSGSGYISAASLRILYYLKDKKINILYIEPDTEFLSETKKLMEYSSFHILQEYARSGVFNKIFLMKNSNLVNIIGDLPITGYYDSINQYIAPIVHMINVFDNSSPVMTTLHRTSPTSRICTIGIINIGTGEEELFFPLDLIKEKQYYYAINEENLKTDGTLLSRIKKQIKKTPEGVHSSFGIYSTSYETDYVYTVSYSSAVQIKM
tara:strand:+ start:452 stop:1291 length:840 start_codon:yes stop_codon:yes gene_type:complete